MALSLPAATVVEDPARCGLGQALLLALASHFCGTGVPAVGVEPRPARATLRRRDQALSNTPSMQQTDRTSGENLGITLVTNRFEASRIILDAGLASRPLTSD